MRLPQIAWCFLAAASAALAQTSPPFVGGAWSGNITPTSATVVVRLNATGLRVRLHVSQNEALTPAVFSGVVTTSATTGSTAKLTVQGLQPDTDYYYGVEVA